MADYKCSKCKKVIKKTRTSYGYSYDCPCGDFCVQTTKNIVLLTKENNLR